MDCSEEVQSLSDEASTPMELKKGMSIFLDVSRAVPHVCQTIDKRKEMITPSTCMFNFSRIQTSHVFVLL